MNFDVNKFNCSKNTKAFFALLMQNVYKFVNDEQNEVIGNSPKGDEIRLKYRMKLNSSLADNQAPIYPHLTVYVNNVRTSHWDICFLEDTRVFSIFWTLLCQDIRFKKDDERREREEKAQHKFINQVKELEKNFK
jgi:hypothetical protein